MNLRKIVDPILIGFIEFMFMLVLNFFLLPLLGIVGITGLFLGGASILMMPIVGLVLGMYFFMTGLVSIIVVDRIRTQRKYFVSI